MRLIDADALAKKCCVGIEEFGTCEKCLEYYAGKGCSKTCLLEYRGDDVQNAPTIDAIPVKWLRNLCAIAKMETDDEMFIDWLIQTWHEEQEV